MERGSQALPDWAGDGLQSHSHFTKLGFSIGVCIQNYKAIYRKCPTAQPARDSPIQQPARCFPEPAPPQGSGPFQLVGTAKESKQTSFSPPLQSIPNAIYVSSLKSPPDYGCSNMPPNPAPTEMLIARCDHTEYGHLRKTKVLATRCHGRVDLLSTTQNTDIYAKPKYSLPAVMAV